MTPSAKLVKSKIKKNMMRIIRSPVTCDVGVENTSLRFNCCPCPLPKVADSKPSRVCTVQIFSSCTSRPDVCQCPVVQTPMDSM